MCFACVPSVSKLQTDDKHALQIPHTVTITRALNCCVPNRMLQLLAPPFFTSANDVNSAIQDTIALLRVPRSSLGITCSSRGAVTGKLMIKDGPGGSWQDCAMMGMAGKSIPGELAAIQQMNFR